MIKPRTLRPVRSNAGIAAAYKRRLLALLDEMSASYEHWLRAQYRAKPPAMAMDASAARELDRELRRLGTRWQRRIDEAAPRLAAWFARAASTRSEAALRKILRDAGISVKFTITKGMRDVLDATVADNVSLIKSIPSQYATEVQGLVMRSVTAGRDLEQLTRDLRARYDVTERRAVLIARTQNNMATAAMTRVRHVDLGIEEALWLHSHAGREPRPTHLANDRKKYKIAEGWFDPDPKVRRHIWPGELINCRCVPKPIVKGFS